MDGWSGNEVAHLPISVLHNVQKCSALFQNHGFVPTSWTWIKQVHAPKSTNSPVAKDWRPIAVMSIWYRIWSASQFRSIPCQRWFRSCVPTQALGGRKGGEVYDALCQLNSIQHVISLGCSLAFDRVHPRLALGLFAALGMNTHIVQVLENVWCAQKRFLTLDDQVQASPQLVNSSIPQGDSFSLMAMLAVLLHQHMTLWLDTHRSHSVLLCMIAFSLAL